MDTNEILKAKLQKALAENERLRDENAQLRRTAGQSSNAPAPKPGPFYGPNNKKPQSTARVTNDSRPESKVSLFRSLFRGRDDVYAVRWEGTNGRTGYSPAGIREWDHAASSRNGQKRSFHLSKLLTLDQEVIRDHLLGRRFHSLREDSSISRKKGSTSLRWQRPVAVKRKTSLTRCKETLGADIYVGFLPQT